MRSFNGCYVNWRFNRLTLVLCLISLPLLLLKNSFAGDPVKPENQPWAWHCARFLNGKIADATDQSFVVAAKTLTPGRIEKIKTAFPSLEIKRIQRYHNVSYDGYQLTHSTPSPYGNYADPEIQRRVALQLNLFFAELYPSVADENFFSHIDDPNYIPKNDSQNRLVTAAQKFVTLPKGKKAGLFIHGEPGTGKTHFATAIAKELMIRGETVLFVQAKALPAEMTGPIDQLHSFISQYTAFVIDDMNDVPPGSQRVLRELIDHIHDTSKKLVITSNTTLPTLVKSIQLFGGNVVRFNARINALLYELHVTGATERPAAGNWLD